MTLELIRTSCRPVARGRAIVLGGVVALVCSACASEEVASSPAGAGMPPSMTSAYAPPKPQASSAPLGYPFASGASLPTAAANAPTVTR
jgi:hypothetical protein